MITKAEFRISGRVCLLPLQTWQTPSTGCCTVLQCWPHSFVWKLVPYCLHALAEMDSLLSDRWDVREEDEGVVRFVTALRLSVTALPVFIIRAAVTSGRFDGHQKKSGYRKQLAEYLSVTEHSVASVTEHIVPVMLKMVLRLWSKLLVMTCNLQMWYN